MGPMFALTEHAVCARALIIMPTFLFIEIWSMSMSAAEIDLVAVTEVLCGWKRR